MGIHVYVYNIATGETMMLTIKEEPLPTLDLDNDACNICTVRYFIFDLFKLYVLSLVHINNKSNRFGLDLKF